MLINCDLGEGIGNGNGNGNDDDTQDVEAALMPFIDQANIACGFHAGDPQIMQRTIDLAIEHGVSIGAHPSYPDREHFGRRSIPMQEDALYSALHYQIAALEGMVASSGAHLSHIKPHGALYNDMMARPDIRATVMRALSGFHRRYPLVLQATPEWERHAQEAAQFGLELQFEAFADRRYTADGNLQPRSEAGAVLDRAGMLAQAATLHRHRSVTTAEGGILEITAQTLCVHGDTPQAAQAIAALHQLIQGD